MAGTTRYVVMDYVEGTTLQPYCDPPALLPVTRAVEILYKGCGAVRFSPAPAFGLRGSARSISYTPRRAESNLLWRMTAILSKLGSRPCCDYHFGQQAGTAPGMLSNHQFAQPAKRNKKHQWLAVESGETVMQIKIRRRAVFGVDQECPGRNIGAR